MKLKGGEEAISAHRLWGIYAIKKMQLHVTKSLNHLHEINIFLLINIKVKGQQKMM